MYFTMKRDAAGASLRQNKIKRLQVNEPSETRIPEMTRFQCLGLAVIAP
jgi:hypothetical protein